jgi:hypothetical protein
MSLNLWKRKNSAGMTQQKIFFWSFFFAFLSGCSANNINPGDLRESGSAEMYQKFDQKLKEFNPTFVFKNGDQYFGQYLDDVPNGVGIYVFGANSKYSGDIYLGGYRNGQKHGEGIYVRRSGQKISGTWISGNLESKSEVNQRLIENQIFTHLEKIGTQKKYNHSSLSDSSPQNLAMISKDNAKRRTMALNVTNTLPQGDGSYTLTIRTNSDTASLKLNGEELGGRADGIYVVNRVARAGQDTKIDIVARDVYGNTDTKSIVVSRTVADSAPRYARLDPTRVKTRASTDSVAIIIGIQNYKRVPKAEFANSDASAFYDYAIRALGVKPENIKLMLDEQADEVEILAAFKNWLPVKVKKARTDVYVFYSGHGLPSDDGKNLYILPFGADRQFIEKTALNQQEIITAIQSVSPKSVTMFMDACYSGQTRNGDTLLASARPVSIKASVNQFPAEFTVFNASASDQIASSSPELKHGIFSYYVMRGMEGDADENKDGRITAGELQDYLSEMVGRQAMAQSRSQKPQLIGDIGKVLVSK